MDVDPTYFRMAVENIIDNASKYTPKHGKIKVLISKVESFVKISIQDTGVGIEQEDIKKIFTKFTRLPNKLSAKDDGSGLGLYWVEKIIELHRGRIEVESTINQGTTFNIFIPEGK